MDKSINEEIKELKKEKLRIESECRERMNGHFPEEERDEVYMLRLKDNYQQYMEVIARLSALKSARDKIIKFIEDQRDRGNLADGQKGFSAALCLSDLMEWLKK